MDMRQLFSSHNKDRRQSFEIRIWGFRQEESVLAFVGVNFSDALKKKLIWAVDKSNGNGNKEERNLGYTLTSMSLMHLYSI